MKDKKWLIHILIWVVAIIFIYSQVRSCGGQKREEIVSTSEAKKVEKVDKNESNSSVAKPVSETPPEPPEPNKVILNGKIGNFYAEVEECTGVGEEVLISGYLVNSGVDQSIRIYGRDEYGKNSYDYDNSGMYDDNGNFYQPYGITVGNTKASAWIENKFITGIRTKFTVSFKGLQTMGGQLTSKKVAVFELRGRMNEKYFNIQFRNILINQPGVTPSPSPTPSPIASPTVSPAPSGTTASPTPSQTVSK